MSGTTSNQTTSNQMKAVVCQNGKLDVRDVARPEPGEGNVPLKVLRAGICGSDLHARTHCDDTADIATGGRVRQFHALGRRGGDGPRIRR